MELLRTVREDSGFTQRDLATALGVDQSYVSKCERGIRRLDVVELRNWVCAMGLSFGTFAERLDSSLEQVAALDQLASKKVRS